MVLENFIRLVDGVPISMHFTAYTIAPIDRRDPLTGFISQVNSLIFNVDMENGQPVSKTFSTLSSKLAAMFEPFLADEDYKRRTFIITKRGSSFDTDFEFQAPLR